MSDLSISLEALESIRTTRRQSTAAAPRRRTQLPVSSYFDEALFAKEKALLFDRGPRYVGHELAVPNVGDYHTLAHEGDGRALIRSERGVELVSNVCRHRQAVMLKGRGNTPGNVVCPLHRWTYDLRGQLVGAPQFREDPCLHLRNYPLHAWNGMLFEAVGRDPHIDLAQLGPRAELDFTGYVHDRTVVHECNYNWKTFIEVYLEDYHVGPFHPGLGQFVSCDDLRWEFGPEHSVQTVGASAVFHRGGTPTYQRWHDAVLAYRNGEPPPHGAIWLTYYPHLMVEWYPHVLVVSALHPAGPRRTVNIVEFFYPEEVAAFEREFVEAEQAAYLETCAEDDEIAERMDAGRAALLARGDDEAGPYQTPMEDGMRHFHEWYRGRMGANVG